MFTNIRNRNLANKKIAFFVLILVLAAVLRLYKLDTVPPSLSWDEAAVGYNAWTIANYGRDEYGKFLPFYFRSFADDKHPVHVYLTAISTKLLGLNEFSTRVPAAILGIFCVLLIYFLAEILFKNEIVSLSAALFLAISPYNLHFSHFNHEANFALFFFLLALVLFYLSLKKGLLLPFSFLSFIISFFSYHSSEVIIPIILFTLSILYFKEIAVNRKGLIASFFILIVFVVILKSTPELLGLARIGQTSLQTRAIEQTKVYQLTHNDFLGKINLIAIQYSWHFTPQFLFITGDIKPRLSSQIGEFYIIDALFLIFGILYLTFKRSKEGILILVWALSAPLPSSLASEAPHAGRALFMMGSWQLISALGFYFILSFFKKNIFKIIVTLAAVVILTFGLQKYLNYYYGEYTKRYAVEWQYGMKQIVEFVKNHREYSEVYMTDVRSEPYIFFLYYLKVPLPDYLSTTLYNNNTENRSYNTVSHFGRFFFGGWDPSRSLPKKEVLYVTTPNEYDGLGHKLLFDVKQVIYYPNGSDAFFLVSAKND